MKANTTRFLESPSPALLEAASVSPKCSLASLASVPRRQVEQQEKEANVQAARAKEIADDDVFALQIF